MKTDHPIVLLGAGLAGSLMAAYLARRGFRVDVYERRPDMRQVEISAGKSINLALSVRGLHALAGVGLRKEILDMVIPMRGRMMHSLTGELTYQPYSKDAKTAINSISRSGLNITMMNLADSSGRANFIFGERCLGIDFEKKIVILQNENSGQIRQLEAATIMGTDGAFSGVRGSLEKSPRFDFSQEYHSAAYKELAIPPGRDGNWQMEKHALHIWPRGSFMLIALPNLDGSYTVTLFYPAEGKESFRTLDSGEKADDFFRKNFPDALQLIPDLSRQFFANPTGDLLTVKCNPWHYKGNAVILGDAAHAVVPFYGQGMNAAFEDCFELDACIAKHGDDWETVYSEFNKNRVANGHAIADMAIENYFEMRDHVGNSAWLLRKQVEHLLEQKFPGHYISRYEMISFTRIPYADAQRIGKINERILDKLTDGLASANLLNLDLAADLIKKELGRERIPLNG